MTDSSQSTLLNVEIGDSGSGSASQQEVAVVSESWTSARQPQSLPLPRHSLDLPQLRSKPSAMVLLSTLALFGSSQQHVKNFGPSSLYDPTSTGDNVDEDDGLGEVDLFSAEPGSGGFRWLMGLVCSPLEWLENEDEQEAVWSEASARLAARCGRTAAPRMTREVSVKGLSEAVRRRRGMEEVSEEEIERPIVLEEPALTEDSLGLKTWGSALVLAERLVRNALESEESRLLVDPVLELGSGTGLCGIVAARLGHAVTATDLPAIVPNLEHNLVTNIFACDKDDSAKVETAVLDWSAPQESPLYCKAGTYETLVVADPVYQMDHTDLVPAVVAVYLSRSCSARLCLQLPERAKFEDVREALKTKLAALGLRVVQQDRQEGHDDFGLQSYDWTLWQWKESME